MIENVCSVPSFSSSTLKLLHFLCHTMPQCTITTFSLLWVRSTPTKKGYTSAPSPTGVREHIRNTTAQLTSRGVTLPWPIERLMHLKTEIKCLNLKLQSSKNTNSYDCILLADRISMETDPSLSPDPVPVNATFDDHLCTSTTCTHTPWCSHVIELKIFKSMENFKLQTPVPRNMKWC